MKRMCHNGHILFFIEKILLKTQLLRTLFVL